MRLTPKIQKAVNYAADKHAKQKRKGDKLPYVVHPFSVAWMLADYTNNEDVVVAGLLHDILEDVKGSSFEELAREFGKEVATIVRDVSEEKDPNVVTDKQKTWEERKRKYLQHLTVSSDEALMVSVADKIQNLSSLVAAYHKRGEALWKEFSSPPDKKLWFYEEVFAIAKKRLKGGLVADLERALHEARVMISSGKEPTVMGKSLLATLRWNLDYIRKETDEIKSAAKIKTRVRGICDYFSDIMSQYEKDKNVERLRANLRRGFKMFDVIIKELDGNAKEQRMWMLVMTHAADMMVAAYRPSNGNKKK